MARNRYGRDDSERDYYSRDTRGGDLRGRDRYDSERGYGGDGGRMSGPLDREYGYGRGGYVRDDYGRSGYGERADYRPDERRYANYQGGRGEARGGYGRQDDE